MVPEDAGCRRGIGDPATAFAWHNHLSKSVPAADATVTEAPKEIRLWFAEKVEPKFRVESRRGPATAGPLCFGWLMVSS